MIERAEGRLRWEGGTVILVTGCEDPVMDDMVLWDLFGSLHPAAKEIVLDDDWLAQWIDCVKKLPLKPGDLPPALVVDVDELLDSRGLLATLAAPRLTQIRGRLIESTPVILVTATQETCQSESWLASFADVVIQCTEPPKGNRKSRHDWRLVRSRFQAVREERRSAEEELAPAVMGVARFYYDRMAEAHGDHDWPTFLAGWKACLAWQRHATQADRHVHESDVGRRG